ncbi:hypothetical protein KQX54_019746 [Cotesia glomerata]|uniref:Uncharacterized protein n=1 Tax=Cotesia glomerata TaxID=32391 RepID=A0AAV7IAB6_COTGL|nr:hypothetical protein KQX54_019746 [Cotesia glomerata]
MNKKLTLIVFVGVFSTIVDHVLANPDQLNYYNTLLQKIASETGLDVGDNIRVPIINPNPAATPEADNSINVSDQVVVNGKICEIPRGVVDVSTLMVINGRCPEFPTTSNNKPTIRSKKPIIPNEKKIDSKTKIPETTYLYPPFTPRLKELIAEIEKTPVLFRLGKNKN